MRLRACATALVSRRSSLFAYATPRSSTVCAVAIQLAVAQQNPTGFSSAQPLIMLLAKNSNDKTVPDIRDVRTKNTNISWLSGRLGSSAMRCYMQAALRCQNVSIAAIQAISL